MHARHVIAILISVATACHAETKVEPLRFAAEGFTINPLPDCSVELYEAASGGTVSVTSYYGGPPLLGFLFEPKPLVFRYPGGPVQTCSKHREYRLV
jgi:hypothetical protein